MPVVSSRLATFIVTFLMITQISSATDLEKSIKDEHLLGYRYQKKISNDAGLIFNIDYSKPDQVVILNSTRNEIEKLVFEEWSKAFRKEFSAKEREYLQKLYDSPFMKKFFEFNNKFIEKKEINDIIYKNLEIKFKKKLGSKNVMPKLVKPVEKK